MPIIEPRSWQYATALGGGAGGPVGDWVNCEGAALISFEWQWNAAALTAGVAFIEGTNDPLKSNDSIVRFNNVSWWLRSTGVLNANGALVGPTADGNVIFVKNPMAFMRSGVAVSVAGAGLLFNAYALQRALAG